MVYVLMEYKVVELNYEDSETMMFLQKISKFRSVEEAKRSITKRIKSRRYQYISTETELGRELSKDDKLNETYKFVNSMFLDGLVQNHIQTWGNNGNKKKNCRNKNYGCSKS